MENQSMPTVEDMQAAFGIEPIEESESSEDLDTATTPESEESGTDPAEEQTDNSAETKEPPKEEAPKQQPQQTPQQNNFTKQNQAFAKMRTENAQMQKTMQAMAQVLGVNPKQPLDQLTAQLQAQAMSAIAKANNMDPAILQRLDQLEAVNAEYNRIKLEQTVTQSIKTIGDKYGASEDDLEAFLNTLIEDNYDVSKPGADLETEFIKRNFEAINKRAVEKAIQAEQSRSAKGSKASKPSNKQGQEDNTEEQEIDSVEALEKFLSENA